MRRISALPFSPDYFAVTLVMRIIFFSFFFHGGKEYFRIHTESNVDRVVVVVARRDVICKKIYPNIYIYILLRRISFYHPRDAGLDAIYR